MSHKILRSSNVKNEMEEKRSKSNIIAKHMEKKKLIALCLICDSDRLFSMTYFCKGQIRPSIKVIALRTLLFRSSTKIFWHTVMIRTSKYPKEGYSKQISF